MTQTLLGTRVGRVGKSFDTRNRRSFWLIAFLDHNKDLCFCFELRKVWNGACCFLLSCWWTDWTWMKSCTAYPPHAGEKSDRVPGRLGRTKYRDFVIFHHGYLQYSSCAFSSVPTNSFGEWKFCKWYLHQYLGCKSSWKCIGSERVGWEKRFFVRQTCKFLHFSLTITGWVSTCIVQNEYVVTKACF